MKKIISGVLAAAICIAPAGLLHIFSGIDAAAVNTSGDDETLAGYAQRVYELVNEERAKENLSPVNFNPALNRAADIRAREIIQNTGHSRPDGSSWSTVFDENRIAVSSCGENILTMSNMSPVPDIAMSAWMASQIHHDNIMNADYTQLSVGIARDDDNNYYLVQIFANEAVSWDISDGKLSIGGAGRTPSYDPDKIPWRDNLEGITEIYIENGITETGRYLFYNLNNLKSAALPESVKKVDMYSFNECNSLEEIIFMNPECEIEGSTETIPSGAVICGYENSTAQAFAEKYGYTFRSMEKASLALGDVNGDGKINAVDASVILVEYASLSTDNVSTFTDEQKSAGDINGDGVINAVDSSYVLAYYAYLSTGGEEEMEKWLETADLDSLSSEI